MSSGPPIARLTEWSTSSSIRLWVTVFALLVPIYAATASWWLPMDPDAFTNSVTARQLAKTGSPWVPSLGVLVDSDLFGAFGSFVSTPNGPAGQYPPGAALSAVPLYAATPSPLTEIPVGNLDRTDELVSVQVPTLWQATAVAVASTAAAVANLSTYAFRTAGRRRALSIAMLAGLGTSAWSVASDSLYTHGPALLALSLAILALHRRAYLWAGLALGAAVLTRPHLAVSAAVIGIALGASRREWRPIAWIGLGSGLGAAGFLLYNRWAFGAASASGGYKLDAWSRLLEPDIVRWLTNMAGALASPRWGLLVWAPFLLLLLPRIRDGWRQSGVEARALALGGVAYFLVQFKLNRYNPGNTTLYRYPLEALLLWAPLLFVAWQPLSGIRARAWWLTTRVAVAGQAVFAFL